MQEEKDARTWSTRMAVGRMAYIATYYSQAARHFRMALEFAREHNLESKYLSENLVSLGKTLASMGNHKEAEHLLKEALALDEANPENSFEKAVDYTELGLLYFKLGNLSLARDYNVKAVGLLKQFTKPPAETLAKALKQLAILACEDEAYAQARTYCLEALSVISEGNLGKTHLLYGEVLMVQAFAELELGNMDDARELWQQAIQIVEMNRGENSPKVASMMDMFAEMTEQAGRTKATEYLKKRAQEIRDFTKRHRS
jgi:tetratricopeptide (TPR) repeat protein